MFKALSFLFNLVVLVVVLRIFAPGVAEQLVGLLSNVLSLANDAIVEVHETASQTDTWDLSP